MNKREKYLVDMLSRIPSMVEDNIFQQEREMLSEMKLLVDCFMSDKPGISKRIFVMPGLRSIGKTVMLFQLYKYITTEKKFPKKNVFLLNVDDFVLNCSGGINEALNDYLKLIHKISAKIELRKKVFFLIDEAQYDKKWDLTLKTIYDQSKHICVFVTGSSHLSLIGGDTARRAKIKNIPPLNFIEELKLKNNLVLNVQIEKNVCSLIQSFDISHIITLNHAIYSIKKKLEKRKKHFSTEILSFLQYGGFANTFNSNENEKVNEIINNVERIIFKDIPSIKEFRTDTLLNIQKIIIQLALKKPGETSHGKLANYLNISSSKVQRIFEVLEQSGMIFSVKPFSKSRNKYIRAAWKYYFIMPSIQNAIHSKYGTIKEEAKGILLETAVAFGLFKIVKNNSLFLTLMYDKNKQTNVDFLINDIANDNVIPIECGFKKNKKQLLNAIKRYKAKHGILVTDSNIIEVKEQIITIPYHFFLMI